MFCKNCGKEIDDKAVICIYCGCATGNDTVNVNSEFCKLKLFLVKI